MGSEAARGTSEPVIAHALAELARTMESERDPDRLLDRITRAARNEVPGAEHAGLMVISRSSVHTRAATDELVGKVDAAQYEAGEGPCLAAADGDVVVRASDLAADPRWPRFAPMAVGLGVRSMLSFMLFVDAGSVGALNLYATEPDAFPEGVEEIGLLLAAHAAVAIVAARERVNLRIAVGNRDLIGQAKGILMERHRVSADRAFAMLVVASQQADVKLRDVALHLTSSGELLGRRGDG